MKGRVTEVGDFAGAYGNVGLPTSGVMVAIDPEDVAAARRLVDREVVIDPRPHGPAFGSASLVSTGATFGQTLRALRLGFRWWPRIGRFVRIARNGAATYVVKVATGAAIGGWRHPKAGEHLTWWEHADGGDSLLMSCEPLRQLAELVAAGGSIPTDRSYTLDENGEVIG